MLPLLAELRTEAPAVNDRSAVRRTLRLEVQASSPQDATRALIRNLSERGLLIETTADLAIGDTIQVDLPEAGDSTARVVWTDGCFFGCEFAAPVPKAAVSAALLLAPVEQSHVSALPDLPAYAIFGDEQARCDFDREAVGAPGIDMILMASLVVALLMAALFIYALLTVQFST